MPIFRPISIFACGVPISICLVKRLRRDVKARAYLMGGCTCSLVYLGKMYVFLVVFQISYKYDMGAYRLYVRIDYMYSLYDILSYV